MKEIIIKSSDFLDTPVEGHLRIVGNGAGLFVIFPDGRIVDITDKYTKQEIAALLANVGGGLKFVETSEVDTHGNNVIQMSFKNALGVEKGVHLVIGSQGSFIASQASRPYKRGSYAIEIIPQSNYQDGATGSGSISIGTNTISSGVMAVSIGANSRAAGASSISILGNATGNNAMSIGVNSSAPSQSSLAIGAVSTSIAYEMTFGMSQTKNASYFFMSKRTTNTTPTELFVDGSSARLTLVSGIFALFEIEIVARDLNAVNCFVFKRSVRALRATSNASSMQVLSQTVIEDIVPVNGVSVNIIADTTNGALAFFVSGMDIILNWVVVVKRIQTYYF